MIDAFNRVSLLQAVTATAVSTDSINTGLPNRALSVGKDLIFTAQVGTAVTAAGAATVTFEVISADDAALTTNVTVHASSAAIGKATLVSGYRQTLLVDPSGGGAKFRRYIGMRYTVATGPLTAGTFTSFIEADALTYTQYADSIPAATN